jgi:N-methylhydantoinase B
MNPVDLNDPIAIQVLWSRLIAIADRADIVLGRTAFSPIVRESHDYVTVLLDENCRSLAQCSQAIPSFIGCLPVAARAMVDRFGPESLEDGDVLITNDVRIGTGHKPDITIITPIFRRGRIVAYGGSVAHMPDIGGKPLSPDAVDLVEEGIGLPILKLFRAGEPNTDVFEIIAASVRLPDEVLGDIQSQVAANQVMSEELLEFLAEYRLDELTALSGAVHTRAERAMRDAIEALADGTYRDEIWLDGFDQKILVRAALTVAGSAIHVDYTGSSDEVAYGVNVVENYRYAHTAYALKCVLDPETPNNDGSFRPITDYAPEGSILNPYPYAACNARNLVGHAIPSLIFKVLEQVVPSRIQADSGGGPIWSINCFGRDEHGRPFVGLQFFHGGQGGRDGQAGNDVLSFPSNCRTVPIEIYERVVPILIEKKELIPDSGGDGAFRGGLGQHVILKNISSNPVNAYVFTEHVKNAPFGVAGGSAGAAGSLKLDGGEIFAKGRLVLEPGARLEMRTPGGGGWGAPTRQNRVGAKTGVGQLLAPTGDVGPATTPDAVPATVLLGESFGGSDGT